MPAPPFPKAVAGFTAAYVAIFGGLAVARGNREFVFYLAVMLVLIAGIYAVHRRVRFTVSVLWLLSLWGLMHLAGGTVEVPQAWTQSPDAHPVLYSMRPWPQLPRYDQVTHAFGFFVATLASGQALFAATRPRRVSVGFACAAALMGLGFGALNEVVEFAAVLNLPDTNVGDYYNTGWDLVANSVGAVIGAVLLLVRPPSIDDPLRSDA